jgi:pSer/pThr/pTyr-binding forkhead associated (FHA) protein
MSEKTIIIKKDFRPVTIPGKHHRLLCLNGDNKGSSYYLKSKRIILGRSKKVDIPILDQKSSRIHAEIILIGDYYVLTDLGSQNGIFIDEEKVIQHKLKDGDRLLIGKTAFRYNVIINKSEKNKEDESDDFKKNTEFEKIKIKKKGGGSKKRIFIAIFLILVFLFLDEDDSDLKNKAKKINKKRTDEISNLLKKKDIEIDQEIEDRVAIIIQRGLREYREGNYFRSIAEFNYALILSPNHTRASFYLNRTKQDLDKEIHANFDRSKRSLEALKYGEAIVANCEVRKFLKGYELDGRYKDAVSNLNKIKIILNKDQKIDLCGAKR